MDKKLSFYLILSICMLFGCKSKENNPQEYNKEIYTPTATGNFKIAGKDNSNNTLITIFNPWQGAQNISNQFLISRDGIISEGFTGQIIKKNVERIVCMSSTHIAMLDALGAIDKIVGVSGMQYISNPYIRKNENNIPDIGYEGNIDYEKLIATQPDLILLFSINGASNMEPKLNELGIPYLYIGDYVEESPLGKVEWIIPIAEVIGKREEGIKIFKETSDRYNNMKQRVISDSIKRPKIMLNAPFLDSWFMPSTKSYVVQMVHDAGGDYIYKKNTGTSSLPIDMEEAMHLISGADLWINIGTIKSKQELVSQFPKLINTKCVKEGYLYNNNLKITDGGGNDCYESGVLNPDLILRDMIKIFHPELVDEPFYYYKKIE